MTSMPASRSARAMIFAPRSWPSRPGLATTTRIFLLLIAAGGYPVWGSAPLLRAGCGAPEPRLAHGGPGPPRLPADAPSGTRLARRRAAVHADPEEQHEPAED